MGMVAPALVYQVTRLAVPPFTVRFAVVRLKIACPEPLLQADKLVGIAVGAGVTVN